MGAKKGAEHKKYSYETKEAAIQDLLNGMTYEETLKKHDIKNDTQLETWLRIYYKEGYEGLKPKKKWRAKSEKKLTEVEKLRMENDILKKIQALLEREKV